MPNALEVAVVSPSTVLAFWGTSFLLVVTPGADWAYMISAGARNRSVALAVSGLVFGYLILTGVVAAGVAALVARAPAALGVITVAGAAYLIWLGATTLSRSPQPVSASEGVLQLSWGRQMAKGTGVSALNPKGLLLFLALLPQFTTTASHWPLSEQVVLLGVVHAATCAVVYSGVGFGARKLLRARPAMAHGVSRLSGIAMVLIAGLLLVHQFAW